MSATDARGAIEAIWHIESARLIAALARMVRDVGLAEELAQDAFVSALQQWPEAGIPENPGAWLMAAAKHRAIDLVRKDKRIERKHSHADAREGFRNSEPSVAALPLEIQRTVLKDMVQASFEVGDITGAAGGFLATPRGLADQPSLFLCMLCVKQSNPHTRDTLLN